MTKFIIDINGNLSKKTRIRKDFGDSPTAYKIESLGKKIEKDQLKKLFLNPITTIAYGFTDGNLYDWTDKTFTLDKKDILKALDFWINDRVLENDRILTGTGKLDDVNEIELKKLIEVRESILKVPNDTKFSRFVNYDTIRSDTQQFKTWTVEFFQITNCSVGHCYATGTITINSDTVVDMRNFRYDGARFSFEGLGEAATEAMRHITGYFTTSLSAAADEVSGVMGGGRHSDGSQWVGTSSTQPSGNRNPDNWIVQSFRDRSGTFCVRDTSDGVMIAMDFHTIDDAQRWIDEHRQPPPEPDPPTPVIFRTNDILQPGTPVVVDPNNPGAVMRVSNISGTDPVNQYIGRVVRMGEPSGTAVIRLNDTNVDITVSDNSTPRLRTEPPHPSYTMGASFPASIPDVSITEFGGERVNAINELLNFGLIDRTEARNMLGLPENRRSQWIPMTAVIVDRTQTFQATNEGQAFIREVGITNKFERMKVINHRRLTGYTEVTFHHAGVNVMIKMKLLNTRNRINTMVQDVNSEMEIELLGEDQIRIDGDDYRLVNGTDSFRVYRGIMFREMVVNSVSTTMGQTITIGIEMVGNHGSTISFTISNPEGGDFMHTSINHNQTRMWNVELLYDNMVKIGNDIYHTTGPISVTQRG